MAGESNAANNSGRPNGTDKSERKGVSSASHARERKYFSSTKEDCDKALESNCRRRQPDLLIQLDFFGLKPVIDIILEQLDTWSLLSCLRVSRKWRGLVRDVMRRKRYQDSWLTNSQPETTSIQCEKQRSVCTVTGLAFDARAMALSLGDSGNVELWDLPAGHALSRDRPRRRWLANHHKDGVYAVDLNRDFVASGSLEGTVVLWDRESGQLVRELSDHELMVWTVRFRGDVLLTGSVDCSVNFYRATSAQETDFGDGDGDGEDDDEARVKVILERRLVGPLLWADNCLAVDRGLGRLAALQMGGEDDDDEDEGRAVAEEDDEHSDDQNSERPCHIGIYDLSHETKDRTQQLLLIGHTAEVTCFRFCDGIDDDNDDDDTILGISGSCDASVRLWNIQVACLRKFTGPAGQKIWSVDLQGSWLVCGARKGMAVLWNWRETTCENEKKSVFSPHDGTTAVGQVRFACHNAALLFTADGMGRVSLMDYWKPRKMA